MNTFEPIANALLRAYPELDPGDISFSPPPNLDLGDVAIPLFAAAKKLRRSPQQLASEAAALPLGHLVREAVAAGPYLNLRLDRARIGREVAATILESGSGYGATGMGAGQRVVLEHTSINPNASPHVGRARNAMIGDSIARLFRFAGYEVEVHYYVNDMGRQIGLLVLLVDELENLTFDQILDAYVAANERAKTDEAFAAAGYELLVRMEEGDPEVQEKFRAVTDLCLKGQLAVLARIGATYDIFDRESAYLKDGRLQPLRESLEARGALFVDEDERLVVDLAKLGYTQEEGRYFVLMRANGSSMYGYRDLAYTIDKSARGAAINLMVLGEDHKLYAQQLAMILAAGGHAAPEPIYYSYILLKDGKMSTRQGKVVLLSDFLDQAAALALERVREQCRELSPKEQECIAQQVAVAAIRFSVLRVSPNKNVIFDMETNLSFQGDTGPYIQYSCARIQSILRKYTGTLRPVPAEDFPAESTAEWALLHKLSEFPQIVTGAVQQRTCALAANYALDVAHLFSAFYHECPVLTAESEALIQARLHVCQATLQTLRNALHLLGIEVPARM
ncbi:MAG: arginine--tRNA ligase [Candidatus Hydrogenedentes bacterium]|nr:arginine--tRNA ligase [Candidatus Hydrogenedentota bacterium]